MSLFKVTIKMVNTAEIVISDTVTCDYASDALRMVINKHYGKNKFFQIDREISSETRFFGGIYKSPSRNSGGVYGNLWMGGIYIDVDEINSAEDAL
ncbi:Uncharacterised protein [Salmonella enterica subsp. enterica]|nr:Uncharacterised protein [Salmonella enterica subsp. enterica] [Salmonella enterica subsp. enterica serovar Menston]